jgi:predicted cobalt transporter CbtA
LPQADTRFFAQPNGGVVIIYIFYSLLMTALSSFMLSSKKMMTGPVMTGLASFFFFLSY